jgi:hypothetical protein
MLYLNIETGNDAFQGSDAEEVARILETFASALRSAGELPYNPFPLYDLNGNWVGEAWCPLESAFPRVSAYEEGGNG